MWPAPWLRKPIWATRISPLAPAARDQVNASRLRAAAWRRPVRLSVATAVVASVLFPAAWLVHHVYFDRTNLPDLEPFIRFEPPTTGVVRDVHGQVLIELAREYRRIVTYDEVPLILRQAIIAAEDKSFFSHSGVDYRALPRVIQKTAARSMGEWWKGGHGVRLLLPQGGLTHLDRIRAITQQELGWSDERWAQEVEDYTHLWNQCYSV